jgi:hypothetical protein
MMKFRDRKGETESTVWKLRIRHTVQSALRKILKEGTEN